MALSFGIKVNRRELNSELVEGNGEWQSTTCNNVISTFERELMDNYTHEGRSFQIFVYAQVLGAIIARYEEVNLKTNKTLFEGLIKLSITGKPQLSSGLGFFPR